MAEQLQGNDPGESNTSTFVAALVTACITVGAFSAIWAVLHGRSALATRIYQPRVEFAPENKRPKQLPTGIIGFWRDVIKLPDQDIIVCNGLDAYLFVRFLKVFGVWLLFPYFLLTFIVCIPIAAAGQTAGQQGVNKLTFGNVAINQNARHVGHLIVALILMGWTCYILVREYRHFVEVRQAWMTSAQHLTLARSRTVALTGIPDDHNSPSGLNELVQGVNGLPENKAARISMADDQTLAGNSSDNVVGAPQIWMGKKVKDVEQVWQDRNDECARLEGGAGKLLKLAAKNQKKGKTPEAQGKFDAERDSSFPAHRYVLPKKVPSWKQGFLGLIGKKQTFETSPEFIAEKNAELETLRAKEHEQGNTAFLRFTSQHEAHNFARLAPKAGGKSLRLAESFVEVVPEDVVWSNMSISMPQRKIRKIISVAITAVIIIFWAVPVAFVGVVTNIDNLCQSVSWLSWICTLPPAALGIIRGVLPPAGLAILFLVLPMVLRLLVKLQGEILQSEIELKVFSRFWLFQIIHGFLIITLASGLTGALQNIGNTLPQLPTLLAEQLPSASIFFLTLVLTVTFAGAAKGYAQLVPFIIFNLRGILGGNTPRKWYNSQWKMSNYKWATVFPPICLLSAVTIVYSVIQPLICLLAMLAFCFLYMSYKYQLGWVADQPDALETGGRFYIKALRTVFVALYIEGIFLAALFFLLTDVNGGRSKTGLAGGVLLAIATGCIAGLQIWIDWFGFRKPYLLYVHSTHPAKSGGTLSEPKLASVPTNASAAHKAAGPEYGNTTGFHEHAFEHPALWKKQPAIWIADDKLGLGRDLADRFNAKKVEASTEYATLDEDGKLDVTRGPPDEAWFGGRTT